MEPPAATKRVAFEGPCYLKVLINNSVAGAIIGKSGTVIAQIEKQTGCALKLSPANVYYPGTEERVLIMSGEQEALNGAILVVLEKIHDMQCQYTPDGTRKDPLDSPPSQPSPPVRITMKIVVPKSAVAALIGKGGQQIKELQETTNARVHVSSREEGQVERLVTISGLLEEARAAALAIASCVQSDANLKAHMYVDYKTGGPLGAPLAVGYGQAMGYGGPYGAYGPSHCQEILSQQCEISIQVPEGVIGAVIGKSGRYVSEVMKQTGARVQISQKGDFVPGTSDRKIAILGAVGAVHSAHIMLLQRVHSAQEGVNGNGMARGPGMDIHGGPQAHPMLQGNMQYIHPTGFGY